MLSARRERPYNRRSAYKRKKVAPPHQAPPSGLHPTTSVSRCYIVRYSKMGCSTSERGQSRSFRLTWGTSASLIGRWGSSAFRLSTTAVVDVARGLVLLYGIGTSALPSWDPRMGRSNLMGGLAGSGR